MKVIGADDYPDLVRRLTTGLIAQWDAIPESVQASILRDATLAIDPGSPRQTSREQALRELTKSHRASCLAESPRRFPPPWRADKMLGGYVVRDANGQSIAHVYSRSNSTEALQAKMFTRATMTKCS